MPGSMSAFGVVSKVASAGLMTPVPVAPVRLPPQTGGGSGGGASAMAGELQR